MDFYPIFLSLLTLFSTLLGGILAAKYRDDIDILAAFASGVLIAVPLFDVLPETFNLAEDMQVSISEVMYLTAIGFIFVFILDRYLFEPRFHKSWESKNDIRTTGGVVATTELTAHSFLDGLTIGLGFQFDLHVGIIVAVAIICHDFSDGLSTVTVMLNSGNSLKNSVRMLILDAVTPVLGATVTLFVQLSHFYIVLLLPFFAGGFLYMGASDLLPQAHEKNPKLIKLVSSLTGFALIFILAVILNI